MIAAYLRTSTGKQDLASQRALVLAWARTAGVEIEQIRWYEDEAVSGRTGDQVEVKRLLADAAGVPPPFESVVVSELSRLGRSMGRIAERVEALAKSGAKIVLCSSGTTLDYTTLEGRALTGALALAADIEWCLMSERNARGRESIKAHGIKSGRKPTPIPLEAVKAMRAGGQSKKKIARGLSVDRNTLRRFMLREGIP